MITELPEFPELSFDEHGHIYRLNGMELPSVTTLMKPLSAAVYRGIDEMTLDRAARRGTEVHNAIENYIKFGIKDIAPDFDGYFAGFLKWLEERQPVIVGSECRLYHKLMRYAGTADIPCYLNGKLTCVDVKTSAQVEEPLCRVQLEGYTQAWGSHGIVFDGKAILHLRRDGTYRLNPYPARDPEAWTTFGALLTVGNYIQKFM